MRPRFLQNTLVSFFFSFGQSISPKTLSSMRMETVFTSASPSPGSGTHLRSTYFCWVNKWTWSTCTISSSFVFKITSCLLHLGGSATEWMLSSTHLGCPSEGIFLIPQALTSTLWIVRQSTAALRTAPPCASPPYRPGPWHSSLSGLPQAWMPACSAPANGFMRNCLRNKGGTLEEKGRRGKGKVKGEEKEDNLVF